MLETIYFLILSATLGIWGALMLVQRLRAYRHGRRITGTVVDWESRGSKPRYHPVIEFTFDDGSVHRLTSSAGESARHTTRRFTLIHLDDRPDSARHYSFAHFWLPPFILLAMAGGTLCLALRR